MSPLTLDTQLMPEGIGGDAEHRQLDTAMHAMRSEAGGRHCSDWLQIRHGLTTLSHVMSFRKVIYGNLTREAMPRRMEICRET